MRRVSLQEMNEKEKRHHSLAAKTTRYTVKSCILFGIIIHIVALSFYAVSMTAQSISVADSTAHQAAMYVEYNADAVSVSDRTMEIYRTLTPEQREKVGTAEYRAFFSAVDREKESTGEVLTQLFDGILKHQNVYDIYLAMYDSDTSSIVYIADSDVVEEDRLYPGDWEPVPKREIQRFLNNTGEGTLYDIDWTEKYGLLCTVGVPVCDLNNRVYAFVLVDISVENVVTGMLGFAAQLTLSVILITILIAWMQNHRIRKCIIDPINTIARAADSFAADSAGEAAKTDCFADLDIHTGDEVENLALTMANMEQDIKQYGESLLKITAEKERISTELSLAARIQYAMLPHTFPPYPDRKEFDIFATMEAAREVGGDFYDFFLIDDDHLCLIMADVSGKGVPAALFMMISKTILQSCAMLGKNAAEIVTKTNEALCSNNQAKMFVTVWLGILEISTGLLTCVNAGHEYPALKRKNDVYVLYKDKHSFPVGGMAKTRYKEYTLQLEPGDRLFLYTDGIPEAENKAQQMLGTEQMVAALNQEPDADPEKLLSNVREAVQAFVQDAEQFDDMTMMCFWYHGNTNSDQPHRRSQCSDRSSTGRSLADTQGSPQKGR